MYADLEFMIDLKSLIQHAVHSNLQVQNTLESIAAKIDEHYYGMCIELSDQITNDFVPHYEKIKGYKNETNICDKKFATKHE